MSKPEKKIKSLDEAFNILDESRCNMFIIDTGVGEIEYTNPDNLLNQEIMDSLEQMILKWGSYKTMMYFQATIKKYIS